MPHLLVSLFLHLLIAACRLLLTSLAIAPQTHSAAALCSDVHCTPILQLPSAVTVWLLSSWQVLHVQPVNRRGKPCDKCMALKLLTSAAMATGANYLYEQQLAFRELMFSMSVDSKDIVGP